MKFTTLLYLMLSLLLISCSTEDNDDTLVEILGTWQSTAVELQTAADLDRDGTANTNVLLEIPCYSASFIFENNGVGAFEASIITEETDEASDEITFSCQELERSDFLWRLEENQLVLTNPNDSSDITIFRITLNNNNTLEVFAVRPFNDIPADFLFRRQ
ncbi:hypothetical protein [Aquimarina brevivitae]|uniref:Lipocalin-like protein n=1 Tax=Aquimarina brevivitae TaxID=323412 RepID=A0A4Q7PLH1_9FLAO|nr:hypothetical protein [Aquimarina brevivitae]RZS99842.1 hypothetical protein EV197_1070 [Aquimarina brevivitae]